MNVLFLTSTLPRYTGDQQAPFVLEQAVAWQRARPGDTVLIVAPHDAGAALDEMCDGVRIRRFRYLRPTSWQTLVYPAILPNLRGNKWRALQIPFLLLASFIATWRLVKKHDIDLIYAHWVMPQGIIAYLLHQVLGVRYVLQNHSSDLSVFDKFGRVGRRLATRLLHRSEAFFCVNQTQAAHARSLDDRCNPCVLPMGLSLDIDAAAGSDDPAASRYALGTISRLSRKKGLAHLIAAAEIVADTQTLGTIAIAGDGEDHTRLAALPEKSDVTFPGFLSGPDKPAFFADCHAMVFSSVASGDDVEGLPVALLEALACGKPVIASQDTNITQLQEWPQIKHYVTFLADPTNHAAFAQALQDGIQIPTDQITAQRQALQKIMARYRWENLIHEYLAVIEKVHQSKF